MTLRSFTFDDELYVLRDDEAREFVAMHSAAIRGDLRAGAPALQAEALAQVEHWNDGRDEDDQWAVREDDQRTMCRTGPYGRLVSSMVPECPRGTHAQDYR